MTANIEQLADFMRQHPRLFVLTGAGISTDSGIPDYRDSEGNWKTSKPIQGPEFIRSATVRQRYWARSLAGWRHFGAASPNPAHYALADLENAHHIRHIVTQNVDGLHQRSGSQSVTDLHGRLDRVICLSCGSSLTRRQLQEKLEAANPSFLDLSGRRAPDGDVHLQHNDFSQFTLVPCEHCGGPLKPDVVFYGENVPVERVQFSMDALDESDAMLVVGSSLMVYSGFRFCRKAAELGKPIAAINLGTTRADEMFTVKVLANCSEALQQLRNLLITEDDAHATRPV